MTDYKLRFSVDVLPRIDKGLKYVGVLMDGSACCDCYSFRECAYPHNHYKWITYDQFVREDRHILFKYFRMPQQTFEWMFKHGDYRRASYAMFHARNLKHNLSMVPQTASV